MQNRYKLLSDYLSEHFNVSKNNFDSLNICDCFILDDSQIYFDIEKMKESTSKIGVACWETFHENYDLEDNIMFKEAKDFKLGSSICGYNGRGLRKKGIKNLVYALTIIDWENSYWHFFRYAHNLIPEVGEDGINDFISNNIKTVIYKFSEYITSKLKIPVQFINGHYLHCFIDKKKMVPLLFVPKDIVSEGRIILDYDDVIKQIDSNCKNKKELIEKMQNDWNKYLTQLKNVKFKQKINSSINNIKLFKICRNYFDKYSNDIILSLKDYNIDLFKSTISLYINDIQQEVKKEIITNRKLISVNLYKRSLYYLFNSAENELMKNTGKDLNLLLTDKEAKIIFGDKKYIIKIKLFSRADCEIVGEKNAQNIHILIKEKHQDYNRKFDTKGDVDILIVDIDK